MTESKAAFLSSISQALGRQGPRDPAEIAREAAALLPDPTVTQPRLKLQDPVAEFSAKAMSERLSATVDFIDTDAAAPAAIRRYLTDEAAPLSVALSPDPSLEALDWGDIQVHRALDPNEPTAIGRAEWGIAETGSLALFSSPEQPTLYAFLPLRHIVLVPKDRIVGHMEDFWAAFRASGRAHPRNINFVTGVSGTADIESKLVRGAHGPRYLHILIVG